MTESFAVPTLFEEGDAYAAMPDFTHTYQGAKVSIYNCNGYDNQLWTLVLQPGGSYLITDVAADPGYGSGLCLDMPWPEWPTPVVPHDHRQLQLWTCQGTANQK